MTLRELLAHPKVKGVCIGSCVETREPFKEHGHAHRENTRFEGFICLRSLSELRRGIADLAAGVTSKHELAHLISDQIYGRGFHEAARSLGVAEDALRSHPAYKRRSRTRRRY